MSELNPTIEELWKPVPDYEDSYEISNFGRVRSLATRPHYRGAVKGGVLKKLTNSPRGLPYLRVTLSRFSTKRIYLVHRLVALVFIGPPPDTEHACVNHIDADPTNNRSDNLEWVSYSENMEHASRLGRLKWKANHPKRLDLTKTQRGSNHTASRLTEGQVLTIRQLYADGHSMTSMARTYGVSATTIDKIVKRKRWKHVP